MKKRNVFFGTVVFLLGALTFGGVASSSHVSPLVEAKAIDPGNTKTKIVAVSLHQVGASVRIHIQLGTHDYGGVTGWTWATNPDRCNFQTHIKINGESWSAWHGGMAFNTNGDGTICVIMEPATAADITKIEFESGLTFPIYADQTTGFYELGGKATFIFNNYDGLYWFTETFTEYPTHLNNDFIFRKWDTNFMMFYPNLAVHDYAPVSGLAERTVGMSSADMPDIIASWNTNITVNGVALGNWDNTYFNGAGDNSKLEIFNLSSTDTYYYDTSVIVIKAGTLFPSYDYLKGNGNKQRFVLDRDYSFSYKSGEGGLLWYQFSEEAYGAKFLNDLVCTANGTTPPAAGEWATLATAFNNLDAVTRAILKNAAANVGGSNAEKAVAKYDYVLSKYGTGTYANFMDRAVTPLGSPDLHVSVPTESVYLVTTFLIVLLASMATLVFLKRKRT